MKKLLLLTLLGLSLAAGSVLAGDTAPKSATAGKAQVVNAKTLTLNPQGRYHKVHATKKKLECSDCHGDGADDVLFLRTSEFQGKEGPVNREACLVCHKTPKKPTWYGAK